VSEARVVSETQGIIRDVRFELGEEVGRGELLVALDSEIERLQMEQARRQLETARLELSATEQLAERGSTSQAELARVRANAAGAEAAYEQAKKRFEDKSITAPIAGRVAGKSANVTPGNYLNPGVEVARIVDLRELEMEIAVGEREVGFLATGTSVSVSIPACPDLEAQDAAIVSVAAGSDPGTGSFPAVIRWENTCGDTVRSGMSASARIEAQGAEEVLVVPTQAVARDGEGAYVFVAGDGSARRARVETGRRLGSRTEITAGLSSGDIVITTATSRLRDGDSVEVTIADERGEEL
jgi:membrane fusion protein (multidrug efflux system)